MPIKKECCEPFQKSIFQDPIIGCLPVLSGKFDLDLWTSQRAYAMNEIILTQGKIALVDDDDFDKLSSLKWYFDNGYARTNVYVEGKGRRSIFMHRFILSPPKNKQVDHINHNGLDNQKANIRIVDAKDNQRNRNTQKNNTSGCQGVCFHKKKQVWFATITLMGKPVHLGIFKDKNEAISAREKAEVLYGFHPNHGVTI